ncbi:class II D-tagatose-bisphosphate aldolase non-catalytic subunit [Anaerosporobacter sp.]
MKMELETLLDVVSKKKITILGVGVMSQNVVSSALEICKEYNCPLLLIASRNQIEMSRCGFGYANRWNAASLKEYVYSEAENLGIWDYVYLCRDHGGPWQNDKEYVNKISYDEAFCSCLESYYEDMSEGFELLHVDVSRDWNFEDKVDLELAVERTIILIKKLEEYREKMKIQKILYEISLEETGKNNCALQIFAQYVEKMMEGFYKAGITTLPKLIVGDTGTFVRMDKNVGKYEEENVKGLYSIAYENSLLLKEHNADYLSKDVLEKHGEQGIVMANVAPEFAKAETEAILLLCEMEKQYFKEHLEIRNIESGLKEALYNYVMKSNKWKKWIEEDKNVELIREDQEFCQRATLVCGHYFYMELDVQERREKLYSNLIHYGIEPNPEQFIKDNIKRSIERYILAFNLQDLNEKLKEQYILCS